MKHLIAIIFLASLAFAQDAVKNNNSTNVGLPENGLFSGSDIDNVQVNNGNLHIQIPLVTYPGRGVSYSTFLVYDSRGWYSTRNCDDSTGSCTYAVKWEYGNTMAPQIVYSAGYKGSRQALVQNCSGTNQTTYNNYTLREPDGTKHHFMPDDYGIFGCDGGDWPKYADDGSGWMLPNATTAVSKTGTRLNLTFGPVPNVPFQNLSPTGINKTVDTNGNTISGTSDSLGRAPLAPNQYYDNDGATQTLTTTTQSLTVNSSSLCGSWTNTGSTFPVYCFGYSATYSVPRSITLPDGRSYSFTYGSMGQIASLTLPTGAVISYGYGHPDYGDGSPDTGGLRVTSRTVTVNGVSSTWTYTYNMYTGSLRDNVFPHVDSTKVTDPEGNYTISYCNAAFSIISEEDKCQIVKVESYSASGQLLKVEDTEFYSGRIQVPKATTATTYSTIAGDNTLQKLRVETDYDYYASPTADTITWKNPVETREFVYDSSGNNPTLKRRTHTNYLHLDPAKTDYVNRNIADRVTDVTVYDGGTPVAAVPYGTTYSGGNKISQTITAYDEGTLVMRAGVPGHDAAYAGIASRGNPTTVSHWRNTDNSLLPTISTYDDLGHVISTTDPGGHTTNFDYSDAWANGYCSPSGNSYAFLTQTTNALGHRNASTYFACSGLVASKHDENDILAGRAGTTFTYDGLRRPLQVSYPDGGFWSYGYPSSNLITSSQGLDGSRTLDRQFTTDGLGRVIQSKITTDSCQEKVDTTYDFAGHVKTVSNPYCSPSDSIFGITTSEYDALGRLTKTIPPDGTTYVNNVRTQYGGSFTLITDQANKKRKTYSDALGRLVQVDEPGPVTSAQAQSSATITINGTEQSHMDPGVQATASATLSGTCSGSTRQKKVFYEDGTWQMVSDVGGVSIIVNGFSATGAYPNATTSIAQQVVNALNSPSSPVTATLSGSTIGMSSRAPGPNYSVTYQVSYNTDVWPNNPLCYVSSNSGPAMTGGRYPAVTAYDNGSVSLTVAGYTVNTIYGQNSTGSSIANALAASFNGDTQSPVTALAGGATLTLTSKAVGSLANFPISSDSISTQGSFAGPSFTFSAPSSMSGGSDGTGGLAAPYTTVYKYDLLDNVICVEQHGDVVSAPGCPVNPATPIDPSSAWRLRQFTYNSLGQLLKAVNPESGQINYGYDNDGNLISKSDDRGISINYSPADSPIDALHRVTKKTYSNGDPSVNYFYDQSSYNGITIANGKGRRTGIADVSGQTAWSYDPMGRPWTEQRTIAGVSKQMAYQYNLDGSENTLTYPSGSVVSFGYDGAGHLLSAKDITSNINYAQNAQYTASGALTALTLGNATGFAGYSLSNSYNKRLQPTMISASSPSATIMSRFYSYGPVLQNNGNISEITNNLDDTRSHAFTYDQLNRIATAQTPRSNLWGNQFTIDAWGNMTKAIALGSKPEGQHLDQTADVKNRFVGFGYDPAGNLLTSGGPVQYIYDAENRISSLPLNGATYVYDGDGVRVMKSGGTASPTIYWGESFTAGPITETDLSGTIKAEYVYFGGKRIARRDLPSGAVHYYFSDHLNSTNLVYSASGALEEDSDFYPYGGERAYVLVSGNHFKFTGKERDPESGLDYFGARYYGNSVGRFLTPDWADKPTAVPYGEFGDPQSLNLYSYVKNTPVTKPDLDGHCATLCFGGIGAAAGAIIYGGGDIYFQWKAGNKIDWKQAGKEAVKGAAVGFVVGATVGLASKGIAPEIQDSPSSRKKSEDEQTEQSQPSEDLRRPYIRKDTRQAVEDAATRTPDGRPIDPNTRQPIDGKPDLGHKHGNEFWREKKQAQEQGLTQKEFNERMNDPNKYQLEDSSSNRSRKYEKKD